MKNYKIFGSTLMSAMSIIMVGGVATNLNGYQRTTGDMDVWIDDTSENRENLREAFRASGMGDYYMLKTMQIIPGWTDFQLNNGLRIDLMICMKGLEDHTFNECLEIASIAEIEDIKVPFLHINHLIANKKAVNRPKDQIDVIYLEKIKNISTKKPKSNFYKSRFFTYPPLSLRQISGKIWFQNV